MSDCIFCKIIKNEIPCSKVYEDKEVLAFLDIEPASEGHTLVIPKKHYETIAEIDKKDLEKTIEIVRKISKSLLNFNEGINIMQNNKLVAGQIVNHIHFHIIPRNKNDNIKWSRPHLKLKKEEFQKISEKIKSYLK